MFFLSYCIMYIHVLKQCPLDIVEVEYIIIFCWSFKQLIVKAWGEKAHMHKKLWSLQIKRVLYVYHLLNANYCRLVKEVFEMSWGCQHWAFFSSFGQGGIFCWSYLLIFIYFHGSLFDSPPYLYKYCTIIITSNIIWVLFGATKGMNHKGKALLAFILTEYPSDTKTVFQNKCLLSLVINCLMLTYTNNR